jgi:hypothetical protein
LDIRPNTNPAAPLVSRRGFLKAGAASVAALVGAGAAAGWFTRGDDGAVIGDERPEVLSRRELATLMALADRVVAPGDGPSARATRTARRIDRELAFSDGRLTADVRAALAVIEYGPALDFRLRRFTRLGPAEQDAYLAACASSVWHLRRNAFNGLRFLTLFFYYTDDRTWRGIGYGGPMVDRKLPEAANAIEALARPVGARA